jgi:Flp pilus assembly secretin CpaC
MLIRLAFAGVLVVQASNILAEVPPPQPPRPIQAYPVQPATGAVIDSDANAAKLAVLQQKQRECEQLQNEIRQLKSELGTIDQFSVRVQILEVSLTKLRKLGTDFAVIGEGNPSKVHYIDSPRQANIGTNATFLSPAASAPAINGFVQWLKQNNIAKEIASPTLMVADGHPAKLFTGLELPSSTFGTPTTPNDNQRPGIEIDLAAFSRENNRVRIDVRGSVRELDEAHSIFANGTKIPAMKVRSFDTGFEGTIGDPLVLQGLVETRERTIEVGQKTQTEKVEIALVAIITPNRITTPAQPVRNSVNDAAR